MFTEIQQKVLQVLVATGPSGESGPWNCRTSVSRRARKKSSVAIGCSSRTPRNCTQLHSFLRVHAIGNHPESLAFMRVPAVLQGRLLTIEGSVAQICNDPEERFTDSHACMIQYAKEGSYDLFLHVRR